MHHKTMQQNLNRKKKLYEKNKIAKVDMEYIRIYFGKTAVHLILFSSMSLFKNKVNSGFKFSARLSLSLFNNKLANI